MSKFQSDRDWERWGQTDPYFGVMTDDQFRNKNLTQQSLNSFFDSGEKHISDVFETLRTLYPDEAIPQTALDFGCGTGRLLIPISKRCNAVAGIDISESMLKEAQQNCAKFGVNNASFHKSDDTLSSLKDVKVDLIHSYIVLQHIPVARGEQIFQMLINKLNPGGFGAVQFTLHRDKPIFHKFALSLKNRFPVLHKVRNLVKGERINTPDMQMNEYNLNRLMVILSENNVDTVHIKFTDHDILGAILYFQKKK